MKIVTVVGARPQFIKAAPVSKALRVAGHSEYLLHTGQHYNYGMSEVFFNELGLPEPDANLGVGSGPHGQQTGRMLEKIESLLLEHRPQIVLVYGDTNSTLAGALAAVKLRIPLAHVEAGLRSFNREMPEEHNRVLSDHCADLLFCPTQTAVDNLRVEGIRTGIHLVGDTMYDAVMQFSEKAQKRSNILGEHGLTPKGYLLATVHRPYNTDHSQNLKNILAAFMQVDEPLVFPVHPRTRQKIEALELGHINPNLRLLPPVGYLDMLQLERNARLILTNSGGMQKEAYFFAVPCLTLRPETEWVETLEAGWNVLVGADKDRILAQVQNGALPGAHHPELFGNAKAAQRIVQQITVDI